MHCAVNLLKAGVQWTTRDTLILGTKISVSRWCGIATPSTVPLLPLWHTTSHQVTKRAQARK